MDILSYKIEALAVELQRARSDNREDLGTKNQLLDALDDLRAEIVEPAEWPGTFFAPPEFKQRSLKDFEELLNDPDARFKVDRVYSGRNHFAALSVKLIQHDLDSAPVAATATSGVTPVTYGVTPLDDGDVPINGEVTIVNNGDALLDNGRNQPDDVEQVKAGHHDLGAAQVAGIPLKKAQDQSNDRPDQTENRNNYLETPKDAESAVTNNHSDVVEELKAAQTGVLAS